ncbi:MAG: DUF4424 family protein [Phycisphaerae bacterium]
MRKSSKFAIVLATVVLAVGGLAVIEKVLADVAMPRSRWTPVRMESEQVNITLGEKKVAVEAVFHLYNEGKAGKVAMGYPLGEFEDTLNDFTASVDGEAIKDVWTQSGAEMGAGRDEFMGGPPAGPGGKGPAKDGPAAEPYRFDGPYRQWKVFDVPMEANAARVVKVTYWVEPAKLADEKQGDLLHYCYTLRTGATWKGKINEAVVTVTLDGVAPDRIVRLAPAGAAKTQEGKVMTWTMRDFKPSDNIEVTFRPAEATKTAIASE